MATSSPVLRAGPAPHWLGPLRRRHINSATLVGLLPAIFSATWVFGWGAVGRLAMAAAAAVLVELGTQRAMRQPLRIADLSGAVQGVLLAMLLPPTAPLWLLLMGIIVMVVIGKQIYGGVGGYPINPVLIGWAVLLLSWGNWVHPVGAQGLLGTAWLPALWIGGVALVLTGHIKWQAPAGMVLGVALTAAALGIFYPDFATPFAQLGSGSVVLGIFFLSTDTTTSPANVWPRLVFGLAAGIFVVVLRKWGIWAEPVPFALILANLLSPLLDRIYPKAHERITRHA